MNAAELAALIGANRFTILDEAHLRACIGEILTLAEEPHRRDVDLGGQARIDFVTGDGVGIHVKTAGAGPEVLAQLRRYAAADEVTTLLLVTTKGVHACLPAMVGGTVLHTQLVRGARPAAAA